MKWWSAAAAIAAAATLSTEAHAHEFECVKTVNGEVVHEVKSYPAKLKFDLVIRNTHPGPSTVLQARDPMLEALGWSWPTPFTLGVGEAATSSFELVVENAEQCEAIASSQMCGGAFDNVLDVIHDSGMAQCRARVICAAGGDGGGDDGVGGGGDGGECKETRAQKHGLGVWKTHEALVEQCVAGGAVDLGTVTVDSKEEFLGIFWGSPAKYEEGGHREKLDHMRFLLQRELLVATCNVRVFGAAFRDPAEPQKTLSILQTTDCNAIQKHHIQLDLPKVCEDRVRPDFGPATPQHARSIADDPTTRSGQSCQ